MLRSLAREDATGGRAVSSSIGTSAVTFACEQPVGVGKRKTEGKGGRDERGSHGFSPLCKEQDLASEKRGARFARKSMYISAQSLGLRNSATASALTAIRRCGLRGACNQSKLHFPIYLRAVRAWLARQPTRKRSSWRPCSSACRPLRGRPEPLEARSRERYAHPSLHVCALDSSTLLDE